MGLEHWQQMQPGNQQWKQIFMEVRLRWQWNYHGWNLLPIFFKRVCWVESKVPMQGISGKDAQEIPSIAQYVDKWRVCCSGDTDAAIEQSKRANQLESRNRFAMICVIESMDHLILGIPSMVMAATQNRGYFMINTNKLQPHVQLAGLQRQTTPAETCPSVMLSCSMG